MASALPPLSPEYINEYSGYKLLAVDITFLPIIIIAVGLRFYARSLARASWGYDDYFVLVSLVIQVIMHVLGILFVTEAGVGHHLLALEETQPQLAVQWAKYLLTIAILYFVSVVPNKLAILALYQRIFTTKPYRYTVYGIASIVIAAATANVVAGLLQCQPFAFNWDKTMPNGWCFDITNFFRWCSFSNILTDLVMLFLPLPVVWRLHATRNVKIGLTLTFLTGAIGLGTSIARFTTFFGTNPLADGSWASVDLMIWTLLESDVYLMAACFPTYRPLLKRFVKSERSLQIGPPSKTFNSRGATGLYDSKMGTFHDIEHGHDKSDSLSDTVGLVNVLPYKTPQKHAANGNEIRVHKDFDVSSSSRR